MTSFRQVRRLGRCGLHNKRIHLAAREAGYPPIVGRLNVMWQGIYRKWNPVPHLKDKRLYVEAVHDDREGFRIWFGSEVRTAGTVTIVRFETVLLYVNSNESYRLSGVQNSEPLKFPHLFWKVENSQLLKEFHRQSVEAYEDWDITHYAFLSASDCIDVLSTVEPTFNSLIELKLRVRERI